MPVTIPCGQCIGCRLERSRQWAIRLVHENQLHEESAFLTLTYSDKHLPPDGGLVPKDHTLWMKRYRKSLNGKKGRPLRNIKYFHCGEYGDETGRPHYHTLVFGHDYSDKRLHKVTEQGHRIWTSEALDEKWGLGHCYIGSVTFESAAYVARYIMKKQTGIHAEDAYKGYDWVSGEVVDIHPEYITMSNGLGTGWYEQFKDEAYPEDEIIMRGRRMRPPKHYDRLFEEEHGINAIERLKGRRKRAAQEHAADNTTERLRAREQVKQAQTRQLKRGFQ